MASAVTVIRNLSFVGFVGGAAVLATPYLANPVVRTKAVSSILHPARLTAAPPAPPPAADPASPPDVQLPIRTASVAPHRAAADARPEENSRAAPPAPQPPKSDASSGSSDSEFGPSEPSALAYEKQLIDANAPTEISPGDEGMIFQSIVYRDGPDATSTVKGVLPPGMKVSAISIAENGWLEIGLPDGKRDYIYGAAVHPVAARPQ